MCLKGIKTKLFLEIMVKENFVFMTLIIMGEMNKHALNNVVQRNKPHNNDL